MSSNQTCEEPKAPPAEAPASAKATWARWAKTTLLVALWALALYSAISEGVIQNQGWIASGKKPAQIIAEARRVSVADVDQALFLRDIEAHSTLVGSLIWWHNGWHEQVYPRYYRPLTMLGFWTEYHLFGPYRYDRWQTADIFFCVLFSLTLAYFAFRLTGNRWVAVLSMLVFTGVRLLPDNPFSDIAATVTSPNATVVVANWKDQPEAWGGICTLGALAFLLERRWWAALALAFASVCFKESGWLTFPMALLLLAFLGRLRSVPVAVWIGSLIAVVVLILLRASAGPRVFSPHDEAAHGLYWTLYNAAIFDDILHRLASPYWPIPLLGFGLVALSLGGRWGARMSLVARVLIGIALLLLAGAALGWSLGIGFAVGITILLDPKNALPWLERAYLYGLLITLAWREPIMRRLIPCLWLLAAISAIPVALVLQPNAHMLFLTDGIQSVLAGSVAYFAALHGARWLTRSLSGRRQPVKV